MSTTDQDESSTQLSPTILTSPTLIISHFGQYIGEEVTELWSIYQANSSKVQSILAVLFSFALLCTIPGPLQNGMYMFHEEFFWMAYWIILGVASSIGLGTGLHTFVLFLGPHIAQVTLVASECGNLNFSTRGADSFTCNPNASIVPLTLWAIFRKVNFECFCWGFGTALGELPPYFMARAAALAGKSVKDLEEIEKLRNSTEPIPLKKKIMLQVEDMLQKFGFFGIFLFASIPNPLFDLAGITCGHFLVPFGTFFGATFLGKAIIKSSIQAFFVIIIFSRQTLDRIFSVLHSISPLVQEFAETRIHEQIRAFTSFKSVNADDHHHGPGTSIISILWNSLIAVMMLYFAVSIIESLGVQHWDRTKGEKQK